MTLTGKRLLFILCTLACCLPIVNGPAALLAGFVFRNTLGETGFGFVPKLTKTLLQTAVVLLGFCINIQNAAATGTAGFVLITGSVLAVLALGFLLAKSMDLNQKLSMLISSGTAICGGSAIASVAPVMNANAGEVSIALSVIFILNAVAIFVFPGLGLTLDMTQTQFGMWCAVAIHDTSSVVGAASVFGDQALELATTAKLARVLWIIPVMLLLSFFKKGAGPIKFPWFVLLFILAVISAIVWPFPEALSQTVFSASKALMAMVLFFMGNSLSIERFKKVGLKPLLFGLTLWVFVATISGYFILKFF